MIRLLYFAALRQALGCAEETMILPEAVSTLGELRAHLALRGAPWDALLAPEVRMACNQEMGTPQTPIKQGDEVAFFPPVTGG
jgi:sulfur-carrier protein